MNKRGVGNKNIIYERILQSCLPFVEIDSFLPIPLSK